MKQTIRMIDCNVKHYGKIRRIKKVSNEMRLSNCAMNIKNISKLSLKEMNKLLQR